jgi:hypothetical protein
VKDVLIAVPFTVAVRVFGNVPFDCIAPPATFTAHVVAACPVAPVAGDGDPTEPPDVVKFTVMFGTGLLYWSRTTTVGSVATGLPVIAVWLLPAEIAMLVGAPAVALAVKVRGLPVMAPPPAVALSVLLLVPAAVPSVQDVTVAVPFASVVIAVVGATAPPPPVTANVTE